MTETPPNPADDPVLTLLREIREEQRWLYKEVEALLALNQRLPLRKPLPPMRGWVIAPDFGNILATIIEDHRPQHIFELGGGVSTLIAAYSVEKVGRGHITSIDSGEPFCAITRRNLEQHSLTDYATVLHAPLTSVDVNGESFDWYDLSAVPMPPRIDLLVIDGPPQWGNPRPMVRYPALPLLSEHLHSGTLILVDDADRKDEQQAVEKWLAELPVDLLQTFDAEKGAKLLRWS